MAKDSQKYLLYTAVVVEMVKYNARIAPVSYQDSKAVRKSSVFISKCRDVVKEVLATVDAQRRHQVGPDLGRHPGGKRVDGGPGLEPFHHDFQVGIKPTSWSALQLKKLTSSNHPDGLSKVDSEARLLNSFLLYSGRSRV